MEIKKWFSYVRETENFEKYLNIKYQKNNILIKKIGWLKASFVEGTSKEDCGKERIKVIDVVEVNFNRKEEIKEKIKEYHLQLLLEHEKYYIIKGEEKRINEFSKEPLRQIQENYTKKYLRWLKHIGSVTAALIACYIWMFRDTDAESVITIYIDKNILIALGMLGIVFLTLLGEKYFKKKKTIMDNNFEENFENLLKAKLKFGIAARIMFFYIVVFIALVL